MGADDYAIVVGIDKYQFNPPFTTLEGARRDALDFVKWLKAPNGGDVRDEHVDPFTELSDDTGDRPVFSTVVALLGKIRAQAPRGRKRIGRRLYMFLAGHGVSPRDGIDEAGLVTVDAQDTVTPNVPGKHCADQFCLAARFDEVLLFVDCCRVTGLLRDPWRIPIEEKPDPGAASKVKRFYAFATGYGQLARERPHNGVVRGIFSRVLLQGLETRCNRGDQHQLTSTDLRHYIETEMAGVRIDGEEQVPKFPLSDRIVLLDGAVPLVPVFIALRQPVHDVVVLDGGDALALVTPTDVTPTPEGRRFLLPSGKRYVIQAVDSAGQPGRRIDITIGAGDRERRAEL